MRSIKPFLRFLPSCFTFSRVGAGMRRMSQVWKMEITFVVVQYKASALG